MTGSPGQDTPQGGYQPIYLYDSLSITVSNPVLTPTSVNVATTLGVTGISTLGITNTGALTSASGTVTGSLQAGSVSTNGTLNASGQATLGQATVNGSLTVNSGSTLSGATVNGPTERHRLGFAGQPDRARADRHRRPGGADRPRRDAGAGHDREQQPGVYAKTDGFAVAQVLSPGDNGKSSFAYGCSTPSAPGSRCSVARSARSAPAGAT